MGKWRPSKDCIYVVPDIHGNIRALNNILDRILPLRTLKGSTDKIIFLGDYVDRGPNSDLVIDKIIELKKEYGDRIITIIGNHEILLLNGIAPSHYSDDYLLWMENGGDKTVSSYLNRSNIEFESPYEVDRSRIRSFIPDEHIHFIHECVFYYEYEDYIFVHGGIDPTLPMNLQNDDDMIWNRSLYQYLNSFSDKKDLTEGWSKCIVTGHNNRPNPLILKNFMMLDSSGYGKLNVVELRSMTGFMSGYNTSRMVKLCLK